MVPATFETEMEVQKLLKTREGGETEVETPAGFADLLTDKHVIEIRHVIDWKDGVKVLVYAQYFPGWQPRIHLFGGYAPAFRALVEEATKNLGIVVTWESEPYKQL